MIEFYFRAIAVALVILAALLLGTMTAVVGALDRIEALENKTADPDPNPIKTFITEAQALNERLIAEEMERTSADE